MYQALLMTHSWLRWFVLLVAVLLVVRSFLGWRAKAPWPALNQKLSLFFVIGIDIQLVLGLILYLGFSTITSAGMSDFAAMIKNPWLRFWTIEHTTLMMAAIVCAHLGKIAIRHAEEGWAKHRRAAIWFGASLLAMLAGIPWPFMKAGRALFNLG